MMTNNKSLSLDAHSKRQVLANARKAQTQLANVVRMLEDDCYCIDVLQQALAVQGLWKGVIRRIFSNHMSTCFSTAMADGKRERKQALDEVIRVMELSDR
ncbi:metal-sensing transcriptional repressor [Candidatus Uhrbacteria bacterium]|nr:metal-sensing transcriptional repressor [Candidatus Uhrbacteria bacterium]